MMLVVLLESREILLRRNRQQNQSTCHHRVGARLDQVETCPKVRVPSPVSFNEFTGRGCQSDIRQPQVNIQMFESIDIQPVILVCVCFIKTPDFTYKWYTTKKSGMLRVVFYRRNLLQTGHRIFVNRVL